MIIADASFFIALADGKDKWHANALKLKHRLQEEVVVSGLAVAEAVTVIGGRKGGKTASVMGEYFLDNCRIEFLDQRSFPDVLREHLRYDGRLSVSDVHSLSLMVALKVREILSFDSDFDRIKGIARLH